MTHARLLARRLEGRQDAQPLLVAQREHRLVAVRDNMLVVTANDCRMLLTNTVRWWTLTCSDGPSTCCCPGLWDQHEADPEVDEGRGRRS
jgi:hypothetical protein